MAVQDEEPLQGWKAIAQHLGRSRRTAQRWAKKGLPIHRHEVLGVIAYRSELDCWPKSLNPTDAPAIAAEVLECPGRPDSRLPESISPAQADIEHKPTDFVLGNRAAF